MENRRDHVPEPDLVIAGALHVQDRGLQDPLKRQGLVRLAAARAAGELFEGPEKFVECVAQRRQVAATGGQGSSLTVGVVRQRVQQVFEGQMRMSPCRRFAVGDVQRSARARH